MSSSSPTNTKIMQPSGIQFHYRKHKHTPEKVEAALLFDIQNYNPIYTRFFDLNESNFNQLQLNQTYYIQNIGDKFDNSNETSDRDSTGDVPVLSPNYLETTIVDDNGNSKNIPIFVKYSPLLDPIRYLSGKYDVNDTRTNTLPNLLSNETNCNEKMLDKNNASYVDGFFSYLTSKTLHDHNNVHGVDYYGSYLCKQREFSTNIYDDVDYLLGCDFFNTQEEKLFTLDFPYDDNSDATETKPEVDNEPSAEEMSIQRALNIRTKLKKMIGLSSNFIDDDNYDESLHKSLVSSIETVDVTTSLNNSDSFDMPLDAKLMDIPLNKSLDDDMSSLEILIDIPFDQDTEMNTPTDSVTTEITPIHLKSKTHNSSNKIYAEESECNDNDDSRDDCSDDDSDSSLSQSSNTTASTSDNEEDSKNDNNTSYASSNNHIDENGLDNDNKSEGQHGNYKCDNNDDDESGEDESGEDNDESGDGDDESGDDDESYNSDDEKVIAKIKNFPVQAILLEKCVSTLDNIMMNDELTSEEWVSILFQVIMTLIIYQHMFHFTHNDLHTNNVMFIETTEEFIYYLYNEQYYKVPTYGRIFKIIDFGRSIYKFRGELMCSDSFNFKGDAATQYNFGPYFNPNKPVVEPNYSFDLCRFACALFDYFIHDIRKVEKICKEDPVVNLIVKWTIDDKGRNVLYKSSGEERYPDFKLYKMIARSVHNHVPSTQITDPLFDQYKITYKKYKKHATTAAKFLKDGKNTHIFINVDTLPCYCELL
jgi:hypothetical protein